MTREQFLSQYTGEWSPSDGREARFGMDKKEGSAYAPRRRKRWRSAAFRE